MNKNPDYDSFIENIHSRLDSSLDEIDAATQAKITQARYRALDQGARENTWRYWLPTGAVATACVAILMFSLLLTPAVEDTVPLDDFELISNMDELELLEELEFYQWLDEYELPT